MGYDNIEIICLQLKQYYGLLGGGVWFGNVDCHLTNIHRQPAEKRTNSFIEYIKFIKCINQDVTYVSYISEM